MDTLTVTSPILHSAEIRRIKEILDGDNRYKEDYLNGPINDAFDLEAGRAARRAKWWMGYAESTVSSDKTGPIYGEMLHNYLTGKRKLSEEMERRRRARLASRPKKTIGQKALEKLETQLGYHETGNNNNKFGVWYGMNYQPYCAMAVTWAYVSVGSVAFKKGVRWAYVPFIVGDARAGRNWVAITRDPKPGDLVCYNWDGDWDADHVGLFKAWIDRQAGTFLAVEANTAPDDRGNQSNGGGVYLRGEKPNNGDTRKISQVQAFIRVGR